MTEHRKELEVFETSVEINETTYQQKPNHGGAALQQLQQSKQFPGLQKQQLQRKDNPQQWPQSTMQILLWTQGEIAEVQSVEEQCRNWKCPTKMLPKAPESDFLVSPGDVKEVRRCVLPESDISNETHKSFLPTSRQISGSLLC